MKKLTKTPTPPTAPTSKKSDTPSEVRFVQMLRRLHPDAKLRDCMDDVLLDLFEQFPAIEAEHKAKTAKTEKERAAALAERDEYNRVRQAEIQAERQKALERNI